MRNILIVTKSASPITFQSDGTFLDVCKEIARMFRDPSYNMKESDPVYVAVDVSKTSKPDWLRYVYTVSELVCEVEDATAPA